MEKQGTAPSRAVIGCYPSGWIWSERELDWIKSLIPFFDGIATFMPNHLIAEVLDSDPYLAQPLANVGFLRNLDPDTLIDTAASERIISIIERVAADEHPKSIYVFGEEVEHYEHTLTTSHLGYYDNARHVEDLIANLRRMGLASALRDDGLFEVDQNIRSAMLALCVHFIAASVSSDFDLVPFYPPADHLSWRNFHSPHGYVAGPWRPHPRSRVVVSDVETAGVDLRAVPLDEILNFRETYGAEYREYMRNLLEFGGLIDALTAAHGRGDATEVERLVASRREAIQDAADSLDRSARREFRRRALSVGVGLISSGWRAVAGDPVGTALGLAATGVSLVPPRIAPSQFSFLFALRDRGRSFGGVQGVE